MLTIGIAFMNKARQQEINGKEIENDKENIRNEIRKKSGCLGLAFYRTKEYIMDCYLSKMDYTHCEIVFVGQNDRTNVDTCLTFGVFSNQGVFQKERAFTNSSYDWIFLSIEREKYTRMMNFCKKQVGKKYDIGGMMALGIWPRKCPKGTWWCVPFVVSALQKGGILTEYKCYTLDVDDVKNYLEDHPARTCFVIPVQLKEIANRFDLMVNSNKYSYV